MKTRKVRRWTGVMWAALNTSERSYVNAPLSGLWRSITRRYPLLSMTRTRFDLSAADCTPIRVRVTITPLKPRRKGRSR